MRPWLVLFLLMFVGYKFVNSSMVLGVSLAPVDIEARYGPGEVAPEAPLQGPPTLGPQQSGDFRITPLQSFDITALVLSKKRYRFDTQSAISPYDLALGWGPMSDPKVIDRLKIRQSGRWYFWRSKGDLPRASRELSLHSANMHMVPAERTLRKKLDQVREGQVVRIRGHLIRAARSDGWNWQSSLTRSDTGNGACEVVWVEELEVF